MPTLETRSEIRLGAWYPGFARVPIPELTGARRAWRGLLQPLAIAEEVSTIVSDLEASAVVHLMDGGVLHHSPACIRDHSDVWYDARLVGMDVQFDVVLVDYGVDSHPQVFSAHPAISANTYPTHPHLRLDKLARIDRKLLPALCTYLTSDGALLHDEEELVGALDFASIYLAKHLVWLRTATLVAFRLGNPPKDIATDSGLALHFPFCTGSPGVRWVGHWPGPVAPHGYAETLTVVSPLAECPCGSRKTFGQCCERAHQAARRQMAEARVEEVLAQLYANPRARVADNC